ncbi:mitogen-activated protein kinase binding protein 1 [Mortierella sp. AM989]|nr:mitogen-activated protein kinase binding protein 1 [Mortierella sp. AM989]
MRRRRKESECLLKLERVLGLTSNKPMVLSVNSTHDLVAYAAGCVVVLYNHKIDKQVGLLCSSTLKKPSTDLGAIATASAADPDMGGGDANVGRGTSRTQIWRAGYSVLSKLKVPGIIGFPGLQIASNKVTTKVNALAFSADGAFFVTAGLRHIKFWYLNVGTSKRGGLGGVTPNTQVLDGRSGILGELRDSNYVDAVCSPDGRFTYAITSNGVLCLFTEGRIMEKWINLHARGAYSHETLQYIGTLPRPTPVGDMRGTLDKDCGDADTSNSIFADVLASQYDVSSGCLICIYSDRSLYVWDINNPNNAVISRIHLSHSDCVWGAEIIPATADDAVGLTYPPDTFITYSADGSILFWNLDESISMLPPILGPKDKDSSSSAVTREILNILYVDQNCKSLIQLPENQDGVEPGFNVAPVECGVRTAKISADGRLLASGDKGGNLRVHDILSLEQLTYQEAHDTEIMAIDFTDPSSKDSPFFVATAGRDRLLHVFDIMNDYALVQTLDDHSSSITCIRFTSDGSRMMSCGADKSIIFRNRQNNSERYSYQPYHQAPGRATFYEMSLNDESQTISVVSGDRRFNIFALDSGKPIKSFKAETKGDDLTAGMAEICSMNHISLDQTGTIAAASGSDKSIRVYDLLHGTCLAHMICHSELVTSVKFMSGYDRIISTSADGCVLIWRLSKDIVERIQTRIQDNVTLPAYLQTRAAKKTMAPNMVATPGPKPLKFMKSTDKLGVYASEYSGTSRRNSTTSIMSEDGDPSLDDIPDGWNEHRQGKSPRGPRIEDVSKESFAPVTVSLAGSPRTSGTRARAAGSISKTPITRSQQNSTSQSATTRPQPLSPARSTAQPEHPPWNKNFVKEKVKTSSPSTKSSGSTTPRQRTPKPAVKSNWLTPNNTRQRATSLTVPTEATLRMDNANMESRLRERQSLSDYTRDDPPTAPGDDDDDELSDDCGSGFEDGPGFIPHGLGSRDITGIALTNVLDALKSKDKEANLLRKLPKSYADKDRQKSQSREPSQAGSETEPTDETGASEEPDGDDEEADEDETVSGTGSDNDIISPLSPVRRINTGSIVSRHGSNGEDLGGFNEGERLNDSPISERSQQVISPSGRVISIHSAVAGRRSISSIFLTAHAATAMMGLMHEALQKRVPDPDDDSRHASSHTTTEAQKIPNKEPPIVIPEAKQATSEQSKSYSLTIGSKERPTVHDNQDRPLEERLNLQSLNAAASKWKQRSLSSGSNATGQQGDLGTERKAVISQHDENQSVVTSCDHSTGTASAEIVPKAAVISQVTFSFEELKESTKLSEMSTDQNTQEPSQPQPLEGILASPVAVKSPEGININSLGTNRSLSHALSAQDNNSSRSLAASGEDERQHRANGEVYSSEQSLQDAFDRISFLISHKAMTATRPDHLRYEAQHGEGVTGSEGTEADANSDRVKEAKKWMLETREGLLNLVGEVQGHLWVLERSSKVD